MKKESGWTIEKLFEGRPAAFRLFEVVRKYLESLGPVEVSPSKTQVSFGLRTKFAWVWLPQMWIKKQPEDSITVTFDAPAQIKDRRIKQSVQPRPGRWTHHVVIRKPSDLDASVKRWLKEAYGSGQVDRRKRVAPRFAAFIRGINVGHGRTVKMDLLREIFASLGFSSVETILASGNVIFETKPGPGGGLEKRIEDALQPALGYRVDVFIRSFAELKKTLAEMPVPDIGKAAPAERNLVFLKSALDAETGRILAEAGTDADAFRARGNVVYWLRREKKPGTYSTLPLERILGRPFTVRTEKTITLILSHPSAGA
jgi:uncharacterized protein (DUF1697 family)